jgi:hypothetical protein
MEQENSFLVSKLLEHYLSQLIAAHALRILDNFNFILPSGGTPRSPKLSPLFRFSGYNVV